MLITDFWFCSLSSETSHLVGLKAHAGAVSAVHDVMLAVVPQQTVSHGAQELLSSSSHLLSGERWPTAHLVHMVDQNLCSICKVLHWVHADTCFFCYHTQNQPVVSHHFLKGLLFSGQDWQDIRNEVSHTVVPQINSKVCKESSRDL